MPGLATSLSDALPPEPITSADVSLLKERVDPNIDAMLGLEPTPNKNIIVLNFTDERSISTIGVEETGWEVLAKSSVDEFSGLDEAVKSIAEPAMEWAQTYYSSEPFAVFYDHP